MKRFALFAIAVLMLGMAATACKKKEAPPMPPPMPGQGMPGQPGTGMPPGGAGAPAAEKKVSVPDAVKGQWKAVKIEVEFKEKKAKKQFTVPVNSEFKVPDSDLTLKMGEFFPHFTMTADQITSASNNLENPAAQIEIMQAGKPLFKGWLFSKYPSVHPFQHDKYGVTMLEAVKK